MSDLIGQQVQGYVIEAEVGRGGMAQVYRAHHRVLDRVSALKILLPELAGDDNFVERFLREARAAARLEHPNIVPIYEIGQTSNGEYFLAMKYVDGATLRQIANAQKESGGLDFPSIITYITQIASALDYAHANGIVHRDIKPGNVLIDADGGALLTDFGIAQAAEDINVTNQGMLVGTPAYMSPEQAQGFPATAQSDVYALGVVVYELLTGTTPFPHRTPHAVLLGHISEPPLPVHDRNPQLTPELSAVVGKALAKSPDDRYTSAGEFAAALSRAVGDQPSVQLPNGAVVELERDPETVIESSPRRSLNPANWLSEQGRWFIAGVLVMIVVLIGASLVISPGLVGLGAADDAGTLSITTVPTGAELSINGQPVGSAPRIITDLPEGEHVIQATMPSFSPAEESVRIGEDDGEISLILQPLPAAATLQVTRATMTHGIEVNSDGIEAPIDTAVEFGPGEEAIAFAFVVSSAFEVRDLEFVFQSRWYDPAGTLRSTSPPTTVRFDRSGQVWHLSASDRAGDIDPLASGEPSTVELLVDDVVIQTLQFQVKSSS